MEKKGNTNLNQRKREIKMKTLPVVLVGLMASLAIGVSTRRGQVSYSLEDLEVVKEMEYSEAAAINNQENVAGTAYKGLETCAFHYSYKFMLDAGTRRTVSPAGSSGLPDLRSCRNNRTGNERRSYEYIISAKKTIPSLGVLYSACLVGSPSLWDGMFDRHRYSTGLLPS